MFGMLDMEVVEGLIGIAALEGLGHGVLKTGVNFVRITLTLTYANSNNIFRKQLLQQNRHPDLPGIYPFLRGAR